METWQGSRKFRSLGNRGADLAVSAPPGVGGQQGIQSVRSGCPSCLGAEREGQYGGAVPQSAAGVRQRSAESRPSPTGLGYPKFVAQ